MSSDRPIRVLLVDDEPLNSLRLQDLLSGKPDVEVIGTAEDGVAGVTAVRKLRPDLVFLDVQMPGMTGLDVIREVGAAAMPATIFVTAYDEYAIQAFDAAAIDYLVKPYADERFSQAFDRARRLLTLAQFGELHARLLSVMEKERAASGLYLERFAVEIGGEVRPVSVSDVDYIVGSGPYAELHVGGRRYVIREALQTLEERLDPKQFLRIHRSTIVRLDTVVALHRGPAGDGEAILKAGTRLRVSRSRREALERWLGVAR